MLVESSLHFDTMCERTDTVLIFFISLSWEQPYIYPHNQWALLFVLQSCPQCCEKSVCFNMCEEGEETPFCSVMFICLRGRSMTPVLQKFSLPLSWPANEMLICVHMWECCPADTVSHGMGFLSRLWAARHVALCILAHNLQFKWPKEPKADLFLWPYVAQDSSLCAF